MRIPLCSGLLCFICATESVFGEDAALERLRSMQGEWAVCRADGSDVRFVFCAAPTGGPVMSYRHLPCDRLNSLPWIYSSLGRQTNVILRTECAWGEMSPNFIGKYVACENAIYWWASPAHRDLLSLEKTNALSKWVFCTDKLVEWYTTTNRAVAGEYWSETNGWLKAAMVLRIVNGVVSMDFRNRRPLTRSSIPSQTKDVDDSEVWSSLGEALRRRDSDKNGDLPRRKQ